MRIAKFAFTCLCLVPVWFTPATAQTSTASTVPTSAVPQRINYSGVLKDSGGKTLSSLRGVTFLIYKDEQGGSPLWLETQNITPDRGGHYIVQLGASNTHGLPADIFQNGEARWLAVQMAGEAEQARVLLVAVPYAMKAQDAETIGGLPPSAFMLAAPVSSGASSNSAEDPSSSTSSSGAPPATSNVTTTGGTINAIPLFTTATNIQNSILTQTAATAVNVGGKLNLPATGAATAVAGKNSRPESFVASAFNSGTTAAVAQTFQLQAEPVGNNTATPSGTLNLLYGSGATAPTETGLKINNKGLLTFATGQTFPGTGPGTVTSVGLTAPASDFTVSGSAITTHGTLNIAWNVAPTPANTANAIVKRDGAGNIGVGAVTANALNTTLISATNSTVGAATIQGYANATTGSSWGVYGVTQSGASNAYGVVGYAPNGANSKGVYGVVGSSNLGTGVFGQFGSLSTVGQSHAGGAGLWGDGGTISDGGNAVLGTADSGTAGYFLNNSLNPTLFAANSDVSGYPFSAYNYANNTYCAVDQTGSLGCTGTKNAIVPIYGGKRRVGMSAIESPQNWFEDAGAAELVNGSAVVALDPDFIETVNTEMEYHVFLTPRGDCKGLYVSQQTSGSFAVRELGGGASSLRFDYRIMALRKKYENVRFADHTNDPDPRKIMERMKSRRQQTAAVKAAAK